MLGRGVESVESQIVALFTVTECSQLTSISQQWDVKLGIGQRKDLSAPDGHDAAIGLGFSLSVYNLRLWEDFLEQEGKFRLGHGIHRGQFSQVRRSQLSLLHQRHWNRVPGPTCSLLLER